MERPVNDTRHYQHVELPTNGLKCLLIQDEEADKAAIAVDCCVGQLDDPLEGLAHLTEHLLFLGTEKYPQENGLDSYLSSNGGHSNAYTDLQQTVYYLDCHCPALEGALDRLGACFSCPLLSENSIEREIQAVDSEHAKNIQQDHWRSHQLARNLLGKDHPYGKFGSGSLETLLPKSCEASQRIAQLRQAMVEFYQTYYRACNMTVCVLSNQSIAELQAWVEASFGSIPSGDKVQNAPATLPPLAPSALPQQVHWIPTRDGMTLHLEWPCREIQTLYESKPSRFLSHLLGHEGPGTLLHTLQQYQWAHELGADDGSKSCREFSVFSIQMELTPLGLQHVYDIITMVYAYIGLLRSIPDWVYEELRQTAELQFRFLSNQPPADTVSGLVTQMQYYKPEHTLSGPFKLYEYNPAAIQECLACLTPNNMLVMVASKEFTDTDQTDPNYGTQYRTLPVDSELIQKWQNPNDDKNLTSALHLPEQNDMLATNFDLVEPLSVYMEGPRCLMDTDTCRLWYKPDTAFSMPKVNIMILLRSATAYVESPIHSVLASLWTEVVHEHCNAEFAYAASMAGLHCDFSNTRRGTEIHVSGYNHKASILLQRIVQAIDEMPTKVTAELFERIQDKLEKQFMAFLVADPYQHAIYAADLCLESPKWSIQDRLACLKELTRDDLIFFSKRLLSRFRLEVLVHGNVTADEAIDVSKITTDAWKPAPALHLPALRVVRMEPGTDYIYRLQGWNEQDSNSCVVNLFQMGPMDVRTNATLSLLHHLLREPAFNQLRTEEQLGYIVHTQVKTNGDKIKGLLFLIQSDSFDPIHMDERIEVFLESLRVKLVKMSLEEFNANVDAVCQNLLEKNKNLSEESSKHWHVITNQSYRFQRLQEIAAEARGLSQDDVLRFFDRYLLRQSPYRTKLSVQVFGNNHKDRLTNEVEDLAILIEDPVEFSCGQSLFPVQTTVSVEDMKLDPGKSS